MRSFRSCPAAFRLAVLLLCSAPAGCFAYVPSELAGLPDGTPVRVQISRAAAVRLAQLGAVGFAPEADPTLMGALVRRGDGRIAVRVPVTQGIDAGTSGIVQELALAPDEVLRVDRRRLSRTRTILAAAGAVGLGAATMVLIVNGSTGEPRLPGPGGPDDLRIPQR